MMERSSLEVVLVRHLDRGVIKATEWDVESCSLEIMCVSMTGMDSQLVGTIGLQTAVQSLVIKSKVEDCLLGCVWDCLSKTHQR
jgi:hypothetical protein